MEERSQHNLQKRSRVRDLLGPGQKEGGLWHTGGMIRDALWVFDAGANPSGSLDILEPSKLVQEVDRRPVAL